MGTRSILAIPLDNGFKGRYCHDDGYPSHMARQLHAIVRRDGVETARKVLTEEHNSWGGIYADVERGRTVAAYSDAELESFAPGYGRFYDDPDDADWWVSNDGSDDGTEWAYILNERALTILQRMHANDTPAVGAFGYNDPDGFWLHVGDLPYDQDIDEDYLAKAECGENYERCVHVVAAHVEDAPESVCRKGMRAYMGHEKRGWEEIVAVRQWGSDTWLQLTGSGSTGSARSRDWRSLDDNPRAARYWWALARHDENTDWIRLARLIKAGRRLEYDVKLMATATEPEQLVEKGAVL